MIDEKNPKILIVDDDPQVHKLLGTILSRKNFDLNSAMDAHGALTKLASEKHDMIILDIMMPDMTGIELCQKIREDATLKDTLVLMLSAKDTQSDRLQGFQYGADDYVTKPFHVASLVRKIEHMLQKQDR